MKKKRKSNPIRFRAIRKSATVASAQRVIEKKFKLPGGSVLLINPNGRKARANAKVEALFRNWEK